MASTRASLRWLRPRCHVGVRRRLQPVPRAARPGWVAGWWARLPWWTRRCPLTGRALGSPEFPGSRASPSNLPCFGGGGAEPRPQRPETGPGAGQEMTAARAEGSRQARRREDTAREAVPRATPSRGRRGRQSPEGPKAQSWGSLRVPRDFVGRRRRFLADFRPHPRDRPRTRRKVVTFIPYLSKITESSAVRSTWPSICSLRLSAIHLLAACRPLRSLPAATPLGRWPSTAQDVTFSWLVNCFSTRLLVSFIVCYRYT